MSIANSFLVGRRILCPPLLLSTRILSGLNLCRLCVCCHSLREFPCIAVLLGLDDVIFLVSTPISGSCICSTSSATQTLNLEESHLIKTSNLRLSTSKSLASCTYCLVVGLCVNYHLLQEEVSLVKGERCMDLWIKWYITLLGVDKNI